MENKRTKKTPTRPKDLLLKRIPDTELSDVIAEVWQGKTYGDPELQYHYYRVVREYAFGKKRLRTDKLLPQHYEASIRVAKMAAAACLRQAREQFATDSSVTETTR